MGVFLLPKEAVRGRKRPPDRGSSCRGCGRRLSAIDGDTGGDMNTRHRIATLADPEIGNPESAWNFAAAPLSK